MNTAKQTDLVLSYLKTFGELTTRQAVIELDIMCLPKRIEELRRTESQSLQHTGQAQTVKGTAFINSKIRRFDQ